MSSTPTSLRARRPVRSLRRAGVATAAMAAVLAVVAVVFVARGGWGTNHRSSGEVILGSGAPTTQEREVAPFRAVDLAGSNTVTVLVGPVQRVRVTGDDNLLRLVTTEVRAGRLAIGNRSSFTTRSPMRVDIAVPRLDAIRLSGVGTVVVRGIQAESLSVDLPGSGTIDVFGTTSRLDAVLHGSGHLRLGGLVAAEAVAEVSGSGQIDVHASRALRAVVSGTGTISYGGHPSEVSRKVTGSGAIIER